MSLSIGGELHVRAVPAATRPGFFAPALFVWVNLPDDGVRVSTYPICDGDSEPERGTPVEFRVFVVGGDGPFCSMAFRPLPHGSDGGPDECRYGLRAAHTVTWSAPGAPAVAMRGSSQS